MTNMVSTKGEMFDFLACWVAMFEIIESGIITFASAPTERMFQYLPGELEGQPIEVLMPPRFHEAHVLHRANFFANPAARLMGRSITHPLLGLRKDGAEFPVEIMLLPGNAGPITKRQRVAWGIVFDMAARQRVP